METPEIRLLAAETSISLEAALATAEQIARHGIVESTSFEHLMTLLEEAASGVDRIRLLVQGEDNPSVRSSAALPVPECREPSLQLIPGTSKPARKAAAGPPDLRLVRVPEDACSAHARRPDG